MLCSVCSSPNADNATACRSCGAPLAAPGSGISATVLQAGIKLDGGKFTIGKVLGQGGFGITYLGGDTTLGRPVAIKELFPQGSTRQGTTVCPASTITAADYNANRQKFLEEARVLAQFHHRGIVQVYSMFEENNTAYMVMEFVKGKTLQKLVDTRGPLPEKEVVGYIVQAADALTAVHEAKLLHRDIKPDNLMVTDDGRVVLVDFGTARAFASGKAKQMTRILTPGYAPLEQYAQQAQFRAYTDLYALGGTCYHLLTGQPPVEATDRANGVELPPPCRLNRQVSQTVSDAIMWALEMKADGRPQSAHEFIKAITGEAVRPGEAADEARSHDGTSRNPHTSKITQLVNELNKPLPSPPPSTHAARLAEINRKLALCTSFRVAQPTHCPGCANAILEKVTGQFTGNCPVCRSGRLMQRTLDTDKCPICRGGQLAQQRLDPPIVFCPICRKDRLKEDRRDQAASLPDVWWVCKRCNAEFELGLSRESAKLVRYEQDPFGLAAKYMGRDVPVKFWLRNAPQCNLARKCTACAAIFWELPDASMILVQCAADPHGVASQTRGKCVARQAWAKLAYALPSDAGNAYCPTCHAEFEFNSNARILNLLSCNAQQFGWADELKGQALPLARWCLLSEGKHSCRPGLLCKRCSTEFDFVDDNTYPVAEDSYTLADDSPSDQAKPFNGSLSKLRLVRSTANAISNSVGNVMVLADWQRRGNGIPTSAEERTLRQELATVQTMIEREESVFRERERRRRAGLDAELGELIKKSILAGFISIEGGKERLPLDDGERICWNSPAERLKQRSKQGQVYWDVDDNGTLFVTTQRVVFATPDARRWHRPLSKIHTVRVDHLGSRRDVPVLVMGFDGLQKPVAFYFGGVTASATVDGYQCSVTLTVGDLADMLQSRFKTM